MATSMLSITFISTRSVYSLKRLSYFRYIWGHYDIANFILTSKHRAKHLSKTAGSGSVCGIGIYSQKKPTRTHCCYITRNFWLRKCIQKCHLRLEWSHFTKVAMEERPFIFLYRDNGLHLRWACENRLFTTRKTIFCNWG